LHGGDDVGECRFHRPRPHAQRLLRLIRPSVRIGDRRFRCRLLLLLRVESRFLDQSERRVDVFGALERETPARAATS